MIKLMALTAALLATAAAAQTYPAKPVRIITAGAGGFHDIVTRQLAQRLSERWGQPVVVDNQPAAALTVGTGMAARAAPDGYTLVMSDRSALAVAPGLHKALPYDAQKDLAPITLAALAPPMLVVHPSFPAADLRELIAYAKQRPGQLHYAMAGTGTATHVAGELLKHLAGIDMVPVPYKGGGAAIIAMVSGEVQVGTALIPAALPHVRAGKLKALAIVSNKRFAGAPDIPTSAEAGLPGFESQFWIGLLAPARTRPALIAGLNRDVVEILKTPEMQSALLAQGAEAAPGTPEEFAQFIRSETASMKALIELTGMRVD
jgi:tripartite-type tricarboxylate transporter receptor subunit TctC